MKQIRSMSYGKRPEIRGRAKLSFRVVEESDIVFVRGYINNSYIGSISAYEASGCSYLTVSDAHLNRRWVGRGYGHVLYWALARKAVRMGLKGLRSDCGGRNSYSSSAWNKIATHERGRFSYIKFA